MSTQFTEQLHIMASAQECSEHVPKSKRFRSHGYTYGSSSRDEMNLAEFPLTVLSTRSNPKVKTLEFADSQRLRTGEVIERKWIITGADKFGLPTSTDDDVVLGLMRLTMDQGFRDRKVYFTRYELLKTLKWSTEGRSYSRLTKSLDRLSGVRIRATNSFYDNSSKAYQTCNFGILDAYEIIGERGTKSAPAEQPKSYFVWSEVLYDSFRAGFIKKLDLDLYFRLRSAVSRRLYRYLDKHFYYKSCIEKPLMTLAFEKLGLSRNYCYVSSIKQQIEPAAEELVRVGFLSSYEFLGKGPNTTARFVLKSAESQSLIQRSSQTETFGSKLDDLQVELVEALVSRGISLRQAEKLITAKEREQLSSLKGILRYFDHLVSSSDRKVSKNPAGFLYRAVEAPEKFTVPADFVENMRNNGPRTGSRARPELKVFRSKDVCTDDKKRERYREYLDREVSRVSSEMELEDIKRIHSGVENKMSCLRSVLSAEKFKSAVESCVRDEIARHCKLPDFEAWKELNV